jgi:hypothetical protein
MEKTLELIKKYQQAKTEISVDDVYSSAFLSKVEPEIRAK